MKKNPGRKDKRQEKFGEGKKHPDCNKSNTASTYEFYKDPDAYRKKEEQKKKNHLRNIKAREKNKKVKKEATKRIADSSKDMGRD